MGAIGLSDVETRIAAAAGRAGRTDPIRLVVVTKYASDDAVTEVVAAGARTLGESRADALHRRAAIFGDIEWHFIGSLQRNKVKVVRPIVALLHSMDRPRLAERWAASDGPVPPVLIEVNLAAEPQKGGVLSDDVEPLVEECVRLGIEVDGLMTVPPRPEHPTDSARWFAELRRLRDRIGRVHPTVRELSMGMSDDFEVAVAEGATILRVGRAIFDPFSKEG